VSDLQSTLDAIERLAVHQCGWCQLPLAADGPSMDYCSDRCQSAWTLDACRSTSTSPNEF
jgi:hypothetical protein